MLEDVILEMAHAIEQQRLADGDLQRDFDGDGLKNRVFLCFCLK
jgi:hypothetical protein